MTRLVFDAPRARLRLVSGGADARVSRDAAERLRVTRERTLDLWMRPDDELTSELVAVPAELLHALEPDGLARVGARVRPGDVLIGLSAPAPEEAPSGDALDASLSAALDGLFAPAPAPRRERVTAWDGPGEAEVVRGWVDGAMANVTVRVTSPLEVGDTLGVGDESAVVGAIVNAVDGGDVEWPGHARGAVEVERSADAVEALFARSIGRYDRLTQQPEDSVPVELEAARALLARDARWITHELTTVKCDDADGRVSLYESIVRCAPAATATRGVGLSLLETQLRGLGLSTDLEADTPFVTWLRSSGLRARSAGRVDATDPAGAFRGATPLQIAHVDLPLPVLHPWRADTAAALLDWAPERLVAVLRFEASVDASGRPDGPDGRFDAGGAGAVAAQLASLDVRAIARGSDARAALARSYVLPAGVTMNQPPSPADLVWDAHPVLPPPLQTTALLSLYPRLFAAVEELRGAIDVEASEARRCAAAAAVQREVDTIGDALGASSEDARGLAGRHGLLQTGILTRRVDYAAAGVAVAIEAPDGRLAIPRWAARKLLAPFVFGALERDGHVRTIRGARLLWSTQRPVAEAALDAVARERPLVVMSDASGEWRALGLDMRIWDAPAFGLPDRALRALGARSGDRVRAHLPIDPRAVREATTLGQTPPDPSRWRDAPARGWLAAALEASAEPEALRAALVEAANRGREAPDPVADHLARLLLGRVRES